MVLARRTVIATAVVLAMLALGGCLGHDSRQLDAIETAAADADLGVVKVVAAESTDSEGLDWDASVLLVVEPGAQVSAEQLRKAIVLAVPHLDGYDTVTFSAEDTSMNVVSIEAAYTELGFPLPDPSWQGADPAQLWTTEAQIRDVLKIKDEG